ncbi:U3-aranetoxin-Ce1a-like [Stegodyphus dumicola]|uniref:U3-aranetoxin-Ce1a-like n=1 Tax=Stegodyphus dumicola TaxID=202533 RepID=UPI0015AC5DB6|nr:U3-aranetoxin-Ce1a-like [Stegodyphus dumicola]
MTLAFVIILLLLQVVSSKMCGSNSDCSSSECCVQRDGATRCARLAKKGEVCSGMLEIFPIQVMECPCESHLSCKRKMDC